MCLLSEFFPHYTLKNSRKLNNVMAKFLNKVQNQKALHSNKNPLELVRKRHNELSSPWSSWKTKCMAIRLLKQQGLGLKKDISKYLFSISCHG